MDWVGWVRENTYVKRNEIINGNDWLVKEII